MSRGSFGQAPAVLHVCAPLPMVYDTQWMCLTWTDEWMNEGVSEERSIFSLPHLALSRRILWSAVRTRPSGCSCLHVVWGLRCSAWVRSGSMAGTIRSLIRSHVSCVILAVGRQWGGCLHAASLGFLSVLTPHRLEERHLKKQRQTRTLFSFPTWCRRSYGITPRSGTHGLPRSRGGGPGLTSRWEVARFWKSIWSY